MTAAAHGESVGGRGQVGGDFRNTPSFVNGQPSANLRSGDSYRADPAHRGIRIAAGEFAALNVVGLTCREPPLKQPPTSGPRMRP